MEGRANGVSAAAWADGVKETEELWWWVQREDARFASVIQWREDSAVRPSWQQVAAEGPTIKYLRQQWALL